MDRLPQPSDFAFASFARAAAVACTFELKLRLLADNSPAIERFSLDVCELPVNERARIEIDFHDHWWRNHRPAAPTLFLEELLKAMQQAVEQPRLARVYDKNKRPNVRCIPLPKRGARSTTPSSQTKSSF